jgi:hypothetical protein
VSLRAQRSFCESSQSCTFSCMHSPTQLVRPQISHVRTHSITRPQQAHLLTHSHINSPRARTFGHLSGERVTMAWVAVLHATPHATTSSMFPHRRSRRSSSPTGPVLQLSLHQAVAITTSHGARCVLQTCNHMTDQLFLSSAQSQHVT